MPARTSRTIHRGGMPIRIRVQKRKLEKRFQDRRHARGKRRGISLPLSRQLPVEVKSRASRHLLRAFREPEMPTVYVERNELRHLLEQNEEPNRLANRGIRLRKLEVDLIERVRAGQSPSEAYADVQSRVEWKLLPREQQTKLEHVYHKLRRSGSWQPL